MYATHATQAIAFEWKPGFTVWRGGVVVGASDLQPRGRRFESRSLRFTYNPGQVVHIGLRYVYQAV